MTDVEAAVLHKAPLAAPPIGTTGLRLIPKGLRRVVGLPYGAAHSLDGRDFLVPVMGKTGTTSDSRDTLFVGSTCGTQGITVAVRTTTSWQTSLSSQVVAA